MKPIEVLSVEPTMFKSFIDGDPIEVRVNASDEQITQYGKGAKVQVRFKNNIIQKATIVSEPLEIDASEQGDKTVALVLEKDT